MKQFIITSILLFGISISLQASDDYISFKDINTQAEWNAVLTLSKQQQRPIFVMVHTSWCGYCRKMERDVYTKTKVAAYHNTNFINVKIDAETEFGEGFSVKYQVDAFPGILFLNEKAGVLQQEIGYMPSKDLLYLGKESLSIHQQMDSWKMEYEAGKLDRIGLMNYANALAQQGENKLAQQVANIFYEQHQDYNFSNYEAIRFATKFGNQLNGEIYQKVMAQHKAIAEADYKDYLQSVYDRTLELAIQKKDFAHVEQLISDLLPKMVGKQQQDQLPALAVMTKASFYANTAAYDQYIQLIEAFYQEKQQGNAEFLFDQAYYIVQNYDAAPLLNASIKWIDQAIDLSGNQFSFAMVKAYAYGAQENYREGVKCAKEALTLTRDKQEKHIAQQVIDAFKAKAK
ncbi:MAG: thioredoxin family protein [Flammeovirgaceae bacterium]